MEGTDSKVSLDRTVINKAPSMATTAADGGVSACGAKAGCSTTEQAEFLRSLEEDARERGERRKEREKRGKEAKKRGNAAFKNGGFEKALECFTEAIEETPWDLTLYTNRALVSRGGGGGGREEEGRKKGGREEEDVTVMVSNNYYNTDSQSYGELQGSCRGLRHSTQSELRMVPTPEAAIRVFLK